jgi:hypothetical protein
MKKLTGKCLCEAISYEITGELQNVVNCHCSKCRRWHGAAFRTRAAVESKHFKWLSGEHLITRYYSSPEIIKTFCSVCGSNLISILVDNPDFIGFPLGGLDQDPCVKPKANIFVQHKAPWYEITDGLPQHDEWSPEGTAIRGKK